MARERFKDLDVKVKIDPVAETLKEGSWFYLL